MKPPHTAPVTGPPTPTDDTLKPQRSPGLGRPLGYVGATGLFLALVVFASSAPRGTDQFWYLGDTLTLLANEPRLTNSVFPGPIVRGELTLDQTYFTHHTGVMYMVLPFARAFGAYHGWIVFNTVSVVLTAALIAAALRRLTNSTLAALGYAAFLLLPLTVWQTANLLQEAALGLLTAVFVVLYTLAPRRPSCWLLLFAWCIVAILCHPIYLPVAVASPALFLWHHRRRLTWRHLSTATVVLAAVIVIQAMKSTWFPSTFQPSLRSILLGVIPAEGNMEWHFRAELPALTPRFLATKVTDALARQLGLSRSAVFYWPANVMMAASFVLCMNPRRHKPDVARLAFATAAFTGLFTLMVCWHQNQPRYLLILTPAILITATVFAHTSFIGSARPATGRILPAAILVAFLATDWTLAHRLRHEGLAATLTTTEIRDKTADRPPEDRVVIEGRVPGELPLLSFALRPRKCLVLLDGSMSPETTQRLLDSFQPNLAICRPSSSLRTILGSTWSDLGWPHDYRGFRAYQRR